MQVIGIYRTPRGWAAMVEATPIKLSYVVYPGESFFDGQLVAIEEGRLVFRRDSCGPMAGAKRVSRRNNCVRPTPVQSLTTASAAPANPAPAVPEQQ